VSRILFILNDPPYGGERTYNGLRLAGSLARRGEVSIRIFLMGDAACCAKAGQKTPHGYYNIERMLGSIAKHGGEISACGTCLDARGITAEELVDGVHRGTLEELTEWTRWADEVLVF